MSAPFDPYHKWLGIAPKDQPPNHYRLLGVDLFEDDRDVIDAAANRVLSYLKDLAAGDDEAHSQRIMNEVMQARICLLNPKRKATYDSELTAKQVSKKPPSRSKEQEPAAPAIAPPPSTSSIPAITTSPKPVARTLPKSRNRSRSLLLAVIGGSVASLAAVLLLAFLFVANGERRDNVESAKTEPDASDGSDSKSTDAQPSTEILKAAPPGLGTSHDGQTPHGDESDRPAQVVSGGDSVSESTGPSEAEQAVDGPSANKVTTSTPVVAERSGADEPTILPTAAPLPPAEDARDARRQVDEAYSGELDGATTIEQQVAIARRMFQATNDATEKAPKRFVLLTEAQRLAVAAGDVVFVNEIMERLARDFVIEGLPPDAATWETKAAILRELSGRAETSKDSTTVAEAALATADLAARDGKLDLAMSIVALAIGEARRADDVELFRKATLRLLDLQDGTIGVPSQAGPKTHPPSAVTTPPPAIAPFDETTARQHQEAWAKYLNVPVEMTNSIGMKFVLIPPGEFDMGSTEEEVAKFEQEARVKNEEDWYINLLSGEVPKHRVRITQPFWLSCHEVTRGQFRQFVDDCGYRTEAERDGKGGYGTINGQWSQDPQFLWNADLFPAHSDDHPVVNVSWNDAKAFCQWLSEEETVTSDLPTEAQWEYACRAGTTTLWHSGDDAKTLPKYAWYGDPSDSFHTVGRLQPNTWGLYDMHGNVWELCQDWRSEEYYANSPKDDPTGASQGSGRVGRGGSWRRSERFCRTAFRNWLSPDSRNDDLAFRVVRKLKGA